MNRSCSFWPTPQLQQQGIRSLSVTYSTAHGNAGSLTCDRGQETNPPHGYQLDSFPLRRSGNSLGPFQITASALSTGMCKILCVTFKRGGVSVSHSLLPLLKVRPTGLQSQMLGRSSSQCRTLGWGAGCGVWTPHSLRRTSAIVIVLLFVGFLLGGRGLDYVILPPIFVVLSLYL